MGERLKRIDFANDEMALMVLFIAELTKAALTFTVQRDRVGFQVTLTGGF